MFTRSLFKRGRFLPNYSKMFVEQTRFARIKYRRPIKVNLPESNNQAVRDFIKEKKINIQPVQEVVQEMSEKFANDDNIVEEEITYQKRRSKKKEIVEKKTVPEFDIPLEVLPHLRYKVANDYDLTIISDCKASTLRAQHKLFLLEGKRVIYDALLAGIVPYKIFFNKKEDLLDVLPEGYAGYDDNELALNHLPLYRTKYKQMKIWSNLVTCPGIMGVFKIPTRNEHQLAVKNKLPLTVILDDIRDSKILGSVLRTLACVGLNKVIITEGSRDPWDHDVLRASCGGHFNLNFVMGIKWSSIQQHLSGHEEVYLADICRCEILSNGNIEKIRNFKEETEIPQFNSMFTPELAHEALSESRELEYVQVDDNDKEFSVNLSYDDPEHLDKYCYASYPLKTLHKIDFNVGHSNNGNILIITGENGVTNFASKFMFENYGTELCFSLQTVNSLNTTVSTALIIYEMQRQFNNQQDTN